MNAIAIKGVSKKYRIYHDKSMTLKEHILFFKRTRYEEHQVLKDITFNIEKGTTVGLIGENGSGKSTLLKLLSGIIYPDEGTIEINGRVSSLLELGAGFHPDFSGRENIYNNASIFGLSKSEIDKRYNQIVEFSELEEFIDNPVRTYSSGMYMRLAFAVAINVDADILLIDEILAVGDANFQKKCMDKIKQLRHEGKTIVIVTHDTGSVERICDKAVWLNNGIIILQGEPKKVIDSYLLYMGEKNEAKLAEEAASLHSDVNERQNATEYEVKQDELQKENVNRWGNGHIEIVDVSMLDKHNHAKHMFKYGDQVTIQIVYKVNKATENVAFGIGLYTKERIRCYGTNTYIDREEIKELKDIGTVRFIIPSLELTDGTYCLDVAVHSEEGIPYDYHTNRYYFSVISDKQDVGFYKPKHKWIFE